MANTNGMKMMYVVMKEDDINRYLDEKAKIELAASKVAISQLRAVEGKKDNTYLVINTDEPYAEDVIRIMNRNGHWDGELDIFDVEDIDGCEFVKSKDVGNMIISWHQDFDGYYTGKIKTVYPDGSHGLTDPEEAQKNFNSGKWTLVR